MPEAAIAEPTAAPIEPPVRDWSKLNDLIGDEPETPAAPVVPAKDAVTEPAATAPAAPVVETPDELKNLDAFLAEDKTAPVEEPKAAVTPEVAQLQQVMASPEVTKDFLNAARSMLQLEQTIQSGDIKAAVGMFAPNFQQALTEHIYQQHKEDFVKRFIAESEGKSSTPDPELARLRTELDGIKSTLTAEEQRKQNAQALETQKQNKETYRNYWKSLFKQVGLEDNPKAQRTLRGSVLDSIAEAAETGDKDAQKIVTQIRQGRYALLGQKFREEYTEWIKDQKAKTTADTSIRNAQDNNKTGKIGTAAVDTSAPNAEPDFVDGKRTQGYLKRKLAEIPGWFD